MTTPRLELGDRTQQVPIDVAIKDGQFVVLLKPGIVIDHANKSVLKIINDLLADDEESDVPGEKSSSELESAHRG